MAILSGGQFVYPSTGYGDEGVISGAYYGTSQLELLGKASSYAHIYRSQPWVSAVVDKLAHSAARLPVKVYKRTEHGRDRLREHPYAKLMDRPHPGLGPFSLWLWTVSTFELYGEAMWAKVRDPATDVPFGLRPLHPANIEVERMPDGSKVFRWRAIDKEWKERDIVHFRTYAPESTLRGRSRLEPLRATLISEDAVRRASEAWWRNGARPSVVLTHASNLSDGAMSRIKATWEHLHSGVDRWGSAAVLEEGMTANVMQLTAKDMEMVDSRRLAREEVCAVYDVPPPVVHILDRATFSNITEQMRSMYRDTMAPRLALFEDALASQLTTDFDATGETYVEFDMRDVLRGDFEQRTEAYRSAITSGWMMPREVREAENMPDAGPSANQLWVNAALVPMDAMAEGSDSPAAARTDAVLASVAARLARARTAADIDGTALVKGLPADMAARLVAQLLGTNPTQAIEPVRRELLAIARGGEE